MRGDILYLLLVIGAFGLFFAIMLWLQVTDAHHRLNKASKTDNNVPLRNKIPKNEAKNKKI
jgi:hypothetical protein